MKITAAIITIALAGTALAGPPADVDWLTTFEIAPGNTIAVWTLVDSYAVWPSSIESGDSSTRKLYKSGHLEEYHHIYEHKGDYLRAIAYLENDMRWVVTADTRIEFRYPDKTVQTAELIFPAADGTRIYSSRDGIVVGSTTKDLSRSRSGGFRIYLRFSPPGSLHRPERANRWGVLPPLLARLQKGGEQNEADTNPDRDLSDSDGADAGNGRAGYERASGSDGP